MPTVPALPLPEFLANVSTVMGESLMLSRRLILAHRRHLRDRPVKLGHSRRAEAWRRDRTLIAGEFRCMSPEFRSTLTGDHDRSDSAIEIRSLGEGNQRTIARTAGTISSGDGSYQYWSCYRSGVRFPRSRAFRHMTGNQSSRMRSPSSSPMSGKGGEVSPGRRQ